MDDNSKPYLIIEQKIHANGNPYDAFFLIYREERLRVTPTEYALLHGLLGDEGLNLEEAGEERAALNKANVGRPAHEILSYSAASVILHKLRKKLHNFSPELVLPLQKRGGLLVYAPGLKLYTQAQIADIEASLVPKSGETYVAYDQNRMAHLFINGVEVKTNNGRGIRSQCLALASILIFGSKAEKLIGLESRAFQQAWRQLTGHELKSSNLLKVIRCQLRSGLKGTGYTISEGMPGPSRMQTYRLIPCDPT